MSTRDAEVIAGLIAEHIALGDDEKGIEQCSCGVIAVWRRDEDDVRYLDTHAEGPDLRWHTAHVADALVAAGVGMVADAWDEALREAADDAESSEITGLETTRPRLVAIWLRARADREATP